MHCEFLIWLSFYGYYFIIFKIIISWNVHVHELLEEGQERANSL